MERIRKSSEFSYILNKGVSSKRRSHILFCARSRDCSLAKQGLNSFEKNATDCEQPVNGVSQEFFAYSECEPSSGFIVSKKVGNAVVRNKIKRRFREILRLNETLLGSYDFVVLALPASTKCKYSELEEDFLQNITRVKRLLSSK
jgi:ribonuclease P protein component